jgi:hypothetical protein
MTQKKLNFHPASHGYHFFNDFENHPFKPLPITTHGLCGGMVMSALDYWRSGLPIPSHTADDFNGQTVPAEGTKLTTYIFNRQVDSLLTKLSASRWIVFPWENIPEKFHQWCTHEEFEIVKKQIDMGRPAMLGLWSMDQTPFGHQALCYGYDTNPITLFLYDPNLPDQEATLRPVSAKDGCEMRDANGQLYDKKHYRGYFFQDVYNWNEPPRKPDYQDLVISSGLKLTPSGFLAAGSPLDGTVTVRNIGEFSTRFRNLHFWLRGPTFSKDDDLFEPFGASLPGAIILGKQQERTVGGHVPSFNHLPGNYTATVSVTAVKSGRLSNPIPAGVFAGTSKTQSLAYHAPVEAAVAPAAASLGDKVYVFNKGTDNRIYINAATGNVPFRGWSVVQGQRRTEAAVAAASLGKRIYVFAKGQNDRRIYVNSALDGHGFDGFGLGWSEVQPAGLTTHVAPAAASFQGRLYVLARGDDRGIHVNSAADGQPFSGWSKISLATAPDTGTDVPVAAAALGNRLYVFATFNTGFSPGIAVVSKIAGQPFGGWREVEGGISCDMAAPAAATLGNRVYVFAKKDNRIYVNSALEGKPFDGFGSGWAELKGGGLTDMSLSAASLGGRIYVFAKGIKDKRVYVNSAADGHEFVGWSEVQW